METRPEDQVTRLHKELQDRRLEVAVLAVLAEEEAKLHEEVAASMDSVHALHTDTKPDSRGYIDGCDHCIELEVAHRLRSAIPAWLTRTDTNEARARLGYSPVILSA